MTLEQQNSLQRELDDARTQDEIIKAQSHILLALMDCQRKTSDRVKKLTWKIFGLITGGSGLIGWIANNINWKDLIM